MIIPKKLFTLSGDLLGICESLSPLKFEFPHSWKGENCKLYKRISQNKLIGQLNYINYLHNYNCSENTTTVLCDWESTKTLVWMQNRSNLDFTKYPKSTVTLLISRYSIGALCFWVLIDQFATSKLSPGTILRI